ncbi:MAG: YbaL family putative K(+) efflux transporter [Novosphingobium sp.]
MLHHSPLIGTIVAGLVIAFVMGALAHRAKISPIAGYLIAGVIVGPFTPGFVADSRLATELAEIGVMLLMFGVGLHFSLKDLLSVQKIALPGAVVQIVVATAMGAGLGLALGWTLLASVIFGLALSVASTVVLLRALQARDLVQTERGRIAVGWLVVEDIVMVLALVLLPAIIASGGSSADAGMAGILKALALVIVKVGAFFALMLLVGRKVIPWLLHWTAHTGSRELFRLAVLAIALGVAFGSTQVFGVSLALGAFFAGMILGETQLSKRAAEEILPLRDAFAVLFFVSVGMLFDPEVLIEQPLPVLATVAIIMLGKSLAAYWIVRAFGYPAQSALTISASLAQIGEFSFILVGLGVGLGALPEEGRDLVLAAAIISILLNPIIFSLLIKKGRASEAKAALAAPEPDAPKPSHTVLVGYGRVGSSIARRLTARSEAFTVIEDQSDMAEAAKQAGLPVFVANATGPGVLEEAGITAASTLLIAVPEGIEAGVIARRARELNPALRIIARAHSEEEVRDLKRWGSDLVVMAEEETAARMAELSAPGGT